MNPLRRMNTLCFTLATVVLLAAGCSKRIRFDALPLVRPGQASARLQLTYDRNNIIQAQLSNVPEPSALNAGYTRYVLWAATPDRQTVVNIGQLRIDQNKKAEIQTLTPFRNFILFITAETRGDVTTPGPDVVFETKELHW